jgi:Electron transfer DM13
MNSARGSWRLARQPSPAWLNPARPLAASSERITSLSSLPRPIEATPGSPSLPVVEVQALALTVAAVLCSLLVSVRLLPTEFETDSGPDLRVYVSTTDPAAGGELGDFVDLGGLKGNKGNQQYTLPADLDLGRYSNVVIWCRAFSVGFTSASLAAS